MKLSYESHEQFCLNPLHPGPCRGPRTTRREGVRGIMPGSGRLGTPPPAKKAAGRAAPTPPAKSSGRAAPVPPQRGTVYGTPRKAAKKTAPPAKATGRANPGARASLPPTAQQQRRRSASQDAAGTALVAMKGTEGVRDPNAYADSIARRVAAARNHDRTHGGNEAYNKVITEAALEMATVLARQAGGDPAMQRHNRNDLANAISEAMRTGDISKVQRMKGELGIRSRTASAGEDCGCGSAEGEYETIPEEEYGGDGPDPRGTTVRRWSALLAPIGVPTGDGRTFGAGALSNRSLPLPLRWHREDEGGHKSVVVVGTIDQVEYAQDGVWGGGVLFDPDPEQLPRLAEDIREARLLLEEGVLGPSVDLDDMEFTVAEMAEGGNPNQRPKIDVSKGRISAATLVQIPAFAETAGVKVFEVDATAHELATVVASALGLNDPEEVVDDPTWTPYEALRAVNAAEYPDALLASVCAWSGELAGETAHLYPIRAFREGRPVVIRQAVEFALAALSEPEALIPDHERSSLRTRLEGMLARPESLVAGARPAAPPAEWFADPRLDGPTPLTVTPDGRVFGHLATWGTCHVGFPGACITPPKSRTSYAYFHTGEMLTAGGEPVAVGRITLGGGHADTSLDYASAVAHYDDASTCVAYARAGDDQWGIWLAGALAPDVDDLKAAALRAHPPSGDWRRVAGSLELMGAHAVNTPGFPVPRSRVASGAPVALVAAGALPADPADVEAYEEYSVEDRQTLRDVVVDALREERARVRRASVAVAALESPDTTEGALRAQRAAAAFALPSFIKEKIAKRKEKEPDEPDCDPDDEDCKKKKAKKAKKGEPFGGKKAPPFGSK